MPNRKDLEYCIDLYETDMQIRKHKKKKEEERVLENLLQLNE